MASSRWKRFAFFDRHTLSLPSQVSDDLGLSSRSKSSRRLLLDSNNASDDAVSLVVTTAALPMDTKQKNVAAAESTEAGALSERKESNVETDTALTGMWSTLTACTAPNASEVQDDKKQLKLPSQSQQLLMDPNYTPTKTTKVAVDGLVLLFCSSRQTDLIHCIDVTVRCNPASQSHDTEEQALEDLDGWRGYFAPFGFRDAVANTTRQSVDSMGESNSSLDNSVVSIRALATCREPISSDRKNLHSPVFVACVSDTRVVVHTDPHLHLSCRLPLKSTSSTSTSRPAYTSWNTSQHGQARTIDVVPGLVAVGTDKGTVLVFSYTQTRLNLIMSIPSPPSQGSGVAVSSVKLTRNTNVVLFVAYHKQQQQTLVDADSRPQSSPRGAGAGGVVCFDLGNTIGGNHSSSTAPLARYDLDGRPVPSSSLCDLVESETDGHHFMVAQTDGIYSYSQTQKVGVSPVDGAKIAMCVLPPPERQPWLRRRTTSSGGSSNNSGGEVGSLYALVASMDAKSGRDAIDIYDATNKLVSFHVLLSPGHKALRAVGVSTIFSNTNDGSGGRSSAVVLTSGGSMVTLTEKVTSEKVSLLVQKNLYSAAISMAFGDPSYQPADITALYRRHAEHLYRKGDFSAAMEQYIYTIGSLESSHVIFRYLDAPKIPLLAKYLEELRVRKLASPVHNELLRACYLKLNDTAASEKIAAESTGATDASSWSSTVSELTTQNPKEALALICSFKAQQAAEALVLHGATLARSLPQETAGVVASLCVGSYSPTNLASIAPDKSKASNAKKNGRDAAKMLEYQPWVEEIGVKTSEPYPVHLFARAFLENPKLLRLILSHCSRSRCPLTPSLRRTLLELTLAEWNHAKRTGDTEAERLRRKEAITSLTDAHSAEIGDYEALVLVQQAGFAEGELLLYERLQMVPMLLASYAADGGERARRQMLAMCQSDPEILADVLGYFVNMAGESAAAVGKEDDASNVSDEDDEILDDIREALSLVRVQGVIPPVRIARILAGEGTGQFSSEVQHASDSSNKQRTVPLSVALDYVGIILDESSKDISRLRAEVEEYNQLCSSMETEIASISGSSHSREDAHHISIDDIYSKLRAAVDDGSSSVEHKKTAQASETFWREMDQSEDRFETIARFFAKGVIE